MDLKAEFSRMPFEVLFNTPLAPYTSLHIGGQADFLAFPERISSGALEINASFIFDAE